MKDIKEKEILSSETGDVIVTKLDNIIICVSKSGIKSYKTIPDINLHQSSKDALFTMVASINMKAVSKEEIWNTLDLKDKINTNFVLEDI